MSWRDAYDEAEHDRLENPAEPDYATPTPAEAERDMADRFDYEDFTICAGCGCTVHRDDARQLTDGAHACPDCPDKEPTQ